MTTHQIFWRLLYLSLFIISPYGYTENQFLNSSQESIQFEQKQRLELELNERNQLEKQSTIIVDNAFLKPAKDERCFPIDKIQFVGATQLSITIQDQLTSTYLNRCLTLSEIHGLTKLVTNYYIEQGFITSQAIIPEQDLSSHQLILHGLDIKMEWTKGNPTDAKLPLLTNGDWNKVAQRVAAQSVISSTVNTTIQGGSFTDNFKNALLSNIGNQVNAEGAKLIGDNGEILGHTGKLLGHSVVSGISAEIAGGNAKGAIVGALAAQIAGITINDNLDKTDNWQEQQAQISRIAGAFAGLIATGEASGINSAANSAEIIERYNRQLHLEEIKAVNELANGDKNKLERLLASSCRKVNCIAQESLESSDRVYYESLMKKYPSTYIEDSLLADYWITKERKVVGNYPAFGGVESIRLFTYSKIDSSTDMEAFVFNQWIENASNYTGWSKKNLEDLYFAASIGAMGITKQKPTIKIKNPVIFHEDKFKYLFGHVTSGDHNSSRTNQMANTMKKLGIFEDVIGKNILIEHFKVTPQLKGNTINTFENKWGKFEERESFLIGPSGKATVFHTTYKIENNGNMTFVTTIPKGE
ncbi:TPA: DUF637 domain-containing protein [Providencia alcalifaciens]